MYGVHGVCANRVAHSLWVVDRYHEHGLYPAISAGDCWRRLDGLPQTQEITDRQPCCLLTGGRAACKIGRSSSSSESLLSLDKLSARCGTNPLCVPCHPPIVSPPRDRPAIERSRSEASGWSSGVWNARSGLEDEVRDAVDARDMCPEVSGAGPAAGGWVVVGLSWRGGGEGSRSGCVSGCCVGSASSAACDMLSRNPGERSAEPEGDAGSAGSSSSCVDGAETSGSAEGSSYAWKPCDSAKVLVSRVGVVLRAPMPASSSVDDDCVAGATPKLAQGSGEFDRGCAKGSSKGFSRTFREDESRSSKPSIVTWSTRCQRVSAWFVFLRSMASLRLCILVEMESILCDLSVKAMTNSRDEACRSAYQTRLACRQGRARSFLLNASDGCFHAMLLAH